MCIFSREVESVSNTFIFGRPTVKGRQILVYSMTMSARKDLAMILPIPVPEKSDEDSVQFINLEEYETFFVDLDNGFPRPDIPRGKGLGAPAVAAATKLAVVEVGSFEASFVPSLADFKRLDERFRLPDDAWEKLPAYKKFGFAVFKLKSGQKRIHPMAFEFPNAVGKIFFPTVHLHDGEVHEQAEFDHSLYLQPESTEVLLPDGWLESTQPAKMFMNLTKASGLFDAHMHCYRMKIHGMQKNQDTLV